MNRNQNQPEVRALAKTYLKNLLETDSDIFNTISIENVGLFVHPYDTTKMFIKYNYDSGSSQGGYVSENISVCIGQDGLIDDCFDGMGMRERIQFEADLMPLEIDDNEIILA